MGCWTLGEIRAIIDETFDRCGYPALKNKVTVEWNNRFTTRMGDAIVYESGHSTIRLSKPLWDRASKEQRKQTVIHEACHVVADYHIGGNAKHGKHWRHFMRKMNHSPDVYHSVPTNSRKIKRVAVRCGCGHRVVTCNLATRMRNGSVYKCSRCNDIITL